jgi:hypothetical protein
MLDRNLEPGSGLLELMAPDARSHAVLVAADVLQPESLAQADRAPASSDTADADLPGVLDNFDARQVLHVTYGSVLTALDDQGRSRFAAPLRSALRGRARDYAVCLERHFVRHLAPFASGQPRP